ncbi:MAG: hypothetical protein QXQ02_03520 [Halobacteria archaeon]
MQDTSSEIYIPPQTTTSPTPTVQIDPPTSPIPVSPIATPDTIATYGIQGVIVTLVIALGKPLLDKIYDFFSNSSKQKAELEAEKYKQSVRAANLIEESYLKQRDFLQETVLRQTAQFEEMVEALIQAKNKNTQVLENLSEDIKKEFTTELEALHTLNSHLTAQKNIEGDIYAQLVEINKRVKYLVQLCGGRDKSEHPPR